MPVFWRIVSEMLVFVSAVSTMMQLITREYLVCKEHLFNSYIFMSWFESMCLCCECVHVKCLVRLLLEWPILCMWNVMCVRMCVERECVCRLVLSCTGTFLLNSVTWLGINTTRNSIWGYHCAMMAIHQLIVNPGEDDNVQWWQYTSW
jgi:hypothetical protein